MYIYHEKFKHIPMKTIFDKIRELTNFAGSTDIPMAQQYIMSNIDFKGANLWILSFATIIASVGLNTNSIPVVIGAMLISPIMGPIMGVGLSLGTNNTELAKRSLRNLLIMTCVSILASTIFFLITPLRMENPTELLARTNPTIYDVMIALFGGLAMIVEVCKREKGTVIAGAAIATALIPPLCTAGYGIANGHFSYFIGAIYLYFINMVFIALATFLMVRYLKFPSVMFKDPKNESRVRRWISFGIVLMIIPSIFSAVTVIKENNFNKTASRFVKDHKSLRNGYIHDYDIQHNATSKSTLTLEIAGEKLSPRDVELLKAEVVKYGLDTSQLIINQTSTFEQESIDDEAIIKGIFTQNELEIKRRETYIAKLESEIKELRSGIMPTKQISKELAAQYDFITALTLAKGERVEISGETSDKIIAIVDSNKKLNQTELDKIGKWLSARLEMEYVEVIQK